MITALRRFSAMGLALLLSACQPQPETTTPALPPLPESGAALYRIDPQTSTITLRVYRDGPLARFGHNHVIALEQLQGSVFLHRDFARSGFELRIPMAAAQVDRTADRQAAGADFPGEITPEAIAGTRTNMLGPRLLEADVYPLIELQATGVRGELPDLVFTVAIKVRNRASTLELPARVQISADRIIADGATALSQQQLGLTPYSVLGGGLRVRDAVEAIYHIEAGAP